MYPGLCRLRRAPPSTMDSRIAPPRRTMRLVAFLALCLSAGGAQAAAALKAGVARVEITPSALMPMYGYANRKCGPAIGTHDPLYAKALVLEAGDSRIAIVTLDLGSVVSENLRREDAAK